MRGQCTWAPTGIRSLPVAVQERCWEGDAVALGIGARDGVSTHALLIWGGRLYNPAPVAPPVMFQPTPSSYGEGDTS